VQSACNIAEDLTVTKPAWSQLGGATPRLVRRSLAGTAFLSIPSGLAARRTVVSGQMPGSGRTRSVPLSHNPHKRRNGAERQIGMSIELMVVIVVVLLAVGIAVLRKVRTGSFAPWWWRGKGARNE
jgi:hypothetical protein